MTLYSNSIIRRIDSDNYGRVGAFFKFPNDNGIYGISNNHVIANLNQCNIGDVICDIDNNPVGTLSDWINLDSNIYNNAEFALFKLNMDIIPAYNLWGNNSAAIPGGYANSSANMPVYYPANGIVSAGKIVSVQAQIVINWSGTDYYFTNCLQVVPTQSSPFSFHGDSGGAVYSYDKKLVGIILGINESNTATYVIPFINGILNYISLQIGG